MKKFLPVVVLLALVLIIGGCEKMAKEAAKVVEPTCVGTYSPEATEEDPDAELPSITLNKDASFVMTGEKASEGTYVATDSTITLTCVGTDCVTVISLCPDKKALKIDGVKWVKKTIVEEAKQAVEGAVEKADEAVEGAVEKADEVVEKVEEVVEKAAEVVE